MICACQLSTADRIVVWSARVWHQDPSEWESFAERVDAGIGIEAGRSLCRNLSTLHLLINGAATRPFLLAPMATIRVSDDEQLLVGALAEAQRDDWPLAVTYLEDFLHQDCIGQALDPVSAIVAILGRAGHELTRQPELRLQGGGASHRPGGAAPGSTTAH